METINENKSEFGMFISKAFEEVAKNVLFGGYLYTSVEVDDRPYGRIKWVFGDFVDVVFQTNPWGENFRVVVAWNSIGAASPDETAQFAANVAAASALASYLEKNWSNHWDARHWMV